MLFTFEYKHPGEADNMWRESSQRDTLGRIISEMIDWVEVNALNSVIVEVRLVPLPNAYEVRIESKCTLRHEEL